MDDDRRQFIRHVGDPVAIEAKNVGRFLHRPEDRSGQDTRTDRVEPELELGDDAEVAAAPAQRPEELRVLVRARLDPLAVRQDDLGGEQVVDREPVTARQMPDAAAERQSADAGGGDDAARDRKAATRRRWRSRCIRLVVPASIGLVALVLAAATSSLCSRRLTAEQNFHTGR